MSFDDFVPEAVASKIEHDFTTAAPGRSLWVETNADRLRVYRQFQRWAEATQSKLQAKTVAVGADDPRGPGYRIVFYAAPQTIRPVAAAKLPRFEMLQSNQKFVLNWTGIETNEQVIEATLSAMVPTTIAEGTVAMKMLYAGETPYQIAYCMKTHGCTLKEYRDGRQKAEQQRDRETEAKMAPYRVTPEMKAEEAASMRALRIELGEEE